MAVLARIRTRDEQAVVTVKPDPFRGYRIRVVTQIFSGRSQPERREIALAAVLPDADIAFMSLLTPDEAAASASEEDLLSTSPELPLWPDSLARGQREPIEVRLPSRSDDFLSEPVIATFYSLRGDVMK
ncbi:hypothetical protein [Frankia sp. CcWB2]